MIPTGPPRIGEVTVGLKRSWQGRFNSGQTRAQIAASSINPSTKRPYSISTVMHHTRDTAASIKAAIFRQNTLMHEIEKGPRWKTAALITQACDPPPHFYYEGLFWDDMNNQERGIYMSAIADEFINNLFGVNSSNQNSLRDAERSGFYTGVSAAGQAATEGVSYQACLAVGLAVAWGVANYPPTGKKAFTTCPTNARKAARFNFSDEKAHGIDLWTRIRKTQVNDFTEAYDSDWATTAYSICTRLSYLSTLITGASMMPDPNDQAPGVPVNELVDTTLAELFANNCVEDGELNPEYVFENAMFGQSHAYIEMRDGKIGRLETWNRTT